MGKLTVLPFAFTEFKFRFLSTTIALLLCSGMVFSQTTFEQIKSAHRASDIQLLDRYGEVVQRIRTDHQVRKGQWVFLQDMSPALLTALVLSEDKRFYEHSGVDWQAVPAAAWANLWNKKTRGASTITMQLSGLLEEELKRENGRRSMVQKLGQVISAQRLEQRWQKDQILEAYLNLVPFRGELVGIDALSRTLFGKHASGLNNREAAIAAALVRSPNSSVTQVASRACSVLKMLESNLQDSDCSDLSLLTEISLSKREFPASEGIAPHFARQFLLNQKKPATPRVKSTLDASLQRVTLQSLTQQLRELSSRHVEDGAVLVLDNASGEILCWVGSSGQLSAAGEVDSVMAMRQPGSTLKPFLYTQAIAQQRITAATLLDDSNIQIHTAGGLYIPQNYDHQFRGWVSTRTALGSSLNVPAVRTLVMVSPDAFHKQLDALGFSMRETGDYYGYSLALGSSDVSLLQLTNAYRTLANGGRWSPVNFAPGESSPPKQILDERASFIVTDILADSNARARTFGIDSVLSTRFWSAVKTGTSKDMRDNWAIGFSERFTVGVWVGNASGSPMWNVSGTSGAAPIWAHVMNYLHRSIPSKGPKKIPPGLTQQLVRFNVPSEQISNNQSHAVGMKNVVHRTSLFANEPSRMEWFIKGTEQAEFTLSDVGIRHSYPSSATPASVRITSPANGSIIALDPDIPPEKQRLIFTSTGSSVRWIVDGKFFAKGSSVQYFPWPGRHVVNLLDGKGVIQDTVRFEVRGAAVKQKN